MQDARLAGPGPSSARLMLLSSARCSWRRPCRASPRHCVAACALDSDLASGSSHGAPSWHNGRPGCLPQQRRRAARQRLPRASLALVEPVSSAAAAAAAASATAAAAGATAAAVSGVSLSKVVAVMLGYAVMAGSLFRSVPQIVKVLQHNSTEGLSLTSYVVELCCYSVVIAYNLSQGYGFNTFGEVVACWLQDVILIGLVFRDRRTSALAVAATAAAVAVGCGWLLSPACPRELLALMQASNIAVMALGSRLPQIILNWRRGNAGVLSVTTCLLNVAGNAARIFTTIVLTGDLLMLGGACSQGCLNTILLCQSVGTARARRHAATAGPQPPSQTQPQPQPQPPLQGPEPAPGGFAALQPAT